MRILVLGAGVVGVSTAYYLARDGHEVTVIDRQPGPGLETSFANGGQVSASHATPWSNPATPWKLLGWLGRGDAPLAFHLRWDPAMWGFLRRFIASCRGARSRANADTLLRLALFSRSQLAHLRAETNIAFDAEDRGILHIYRKRRDLRAAAHMADRFRALGLDIEVLDPAGCRATEPALAEGADRLAGGIYSPGDLSGDAHAFTAALAQICADAGVEFMLSTQIRRLTRMSDRISGVMTDRGMVTADRYVVALASYGRALLKPHGIALPIYPAKGYSATVPIADPERAPRVSITDDDFKIVASRLGDRLRIAGMAEFVGYDTEIDPRRARLVLDAGARLFPGAIDVERAEFWTGLRPLTPDGVPVIGATPFRNLILNTGHGTLGWTLACASGRIAADLCAGRAPDIDVAPLALSRF